MNDSKVLMPIIEKLPIFSTFTEEQKKVLSDICTIRKFETGEFLLRVGSEADSCFVICSGLVSIELYEASTGQIRIETLNSAHPLLGWSWMFPPYTYSFDAQALETTKVLSFDAVKLRGLCEEDTAIGFHMMKQFCMALSDRLHSVRLQLIDVYASHQKVT